MINNLFIHQFNFKKEGRKDFMGNATFHFCPNSNLYFFQKLAKQLWVLVLQHTLMHRRIAIFFVTIWISILGQDIATLWYCDSLCIKNSTFRNNCLLRLLTQVQVLSELMLIIKQRDPGKGQKIPSLLHIALHASSHIYLSRCRHKSRHSSN